MGEMHLPGLGEFHEKALTVLRRGDGYAYAYVSEVSVYDAVWSTRRPGSTMSGAQLVIDEFSAVPSAMHDQSVEAMMKLRDHADEAG